MPVFLPVAARMGQTGLGVAFLDIEQDCRGTWKATGPQESRGNPAVGLQEQLLYSENSN